MRIIKLCLKNSYAKIFIIIFLSLIIDSFFILKINNTFDEVTLDWLLLDKKEEPSPLLVRTKNDKSLMLNPDESSKIYDIEKANENVIQIVQLYKDGSFRSFSPKS